MKLLILSTLFLFISCDKNEIVQDTTENINLGATPESSTIVVSVSSDLESGTYNEGDKVKIKVNFSEVVDVSGSPTLELALDSGTRKAVYESGSGSSIITFSYSVGFGDRVLDLSVSSSNALELNGGSIKDSVGDVNLLELPTPGSPNSLSQSKDINIGLSDDFNKSKISSQWTLLDKDNYDMNGNSDTTDDESMIFFQQSGSMTMNGRGGDVWRGTHEFVGMYLNDFTGDFDFSVKIFQRNEVNVWGKSGIMVSSDMSDLNVGGTFQCVTTPQKKVSVQHEGALGDISQHRADSSSSSALPVWIRVKKVGNTLTCFYKYAEVDAWIEHDKGPVAMTALMGTFDVGLISTSHNSGSNSVVQFDDFVDVSQ